MSWPELVNCALLGTARRPVPASDMPQLADVLSAETPERTVLRQAAATALYRAAGAAPATITASGSLAPAEDLPLCPRAQTDVLNQMIHGPYRDVLPEWLAALAATGTRARPEMLIGLLTTGTQHRELIKPIAAVLSQRGRWLAEQSPEWAWACGGDRVELWETGSNAARGALLRYLRNGQPQRARELLESTWETDSAKDRERFLAALACELSLADEPFLERALAARQQGVRAQAGELLARLPRSQLSQRMAARLRGLVTVQRKRLTVELPDDSLTAELVADGLSDKPPHGIGKGAWLLQQLTAAAPLGVWVELSGQLAGKLVTMKVDDGMYCVLHAGWTQAAKRQQDGQWALALLNQTGQQNAWELRELVGLLEQHDAEAFVLQQARTDERGADCFLAYLPRPWSEAFTRKAFERAAKLAYGTSWMRELGAHGHPGAARHLQGAADKLPPGTAHASQAQTALATLAFRQTMLTTLTET